MNQATAHTITTGQIVADNGKAYPDDVYEETSRATGNQQWVADHWAAGDLPTHSVSGDAVKLYTSTENFVGFQYTDGRGKLKHYKHIECIRTRSGLLIGDSSCWARGFARCSKPRKTEHCIDLTSLKSELRGDDEDIYDITALDNDLIVFESGRKYDLEANEWSDPSPDPIDSHALGR
jgi:hypothetical protein